MGAITADSEDYPCVCVCVCPVCVHASITLPPAVLLYFVRFKLWLQKRRLSSIIEWLIVRAESRDTDTMFAAV